jgi:hypothetical protein
MPGLRCDVRRVGRLETAVAGVAKAVAAINRAVPAGAEGNHGIGAALGADDGVHFPRCAVEAAASLLGAPARAAGLAPFGVVYEASGVKELLLSHGKNKLCATIHTYQSSIG